MTINLNKKDPSKEHIFSYIQDIDIYRYYMQQDIALSKSYKSLFREENVPSLRFFLNKKTGEIWFNDFKYKGDCIEFVKLLFNLSYYEALNKIIVDFNLKWHFNYKEIEASNYKQEKNTKSREKLLSESSGKILAKKTRQWKEHDIMFWEKFGISLYTLKKYRVSPISYIFYNKEGSAVKADKYAYSYVEKKDNKTSLKIYQPYNKKYKFLNNHNYSVWQGWEQLPLRHKELIITKSLKDVMAIVENLRIPAVALQSETVLPKQHIIDQLKERFKHIYIWYDNDYDKEENVGQIKAKELATKFGLKSITIPDRYQCKDFSDLIKVWGRKKSIEIYKKEIYLPF